MASLHDICEEMDPSRRQVRASYVFQFLWRDLTSEFDVIGPYVLQERNGDEAPVCDDMYNVYSPPSMPFISMDLK